MSHHESRTEIERAVIGCIMLDANMALPVAINEGLDKDWFTEPGLSKIYGLCMDGFAKGDRIDSLSVGNVLQANERAVLLDCMSDQITTAHAPHYIEMLRAYRRYEAARRVTETATATLGRIHPLESQASIERLQQQMHDLGCETVKTRPLGELAKEQAEEWRKPKEQKKTRVVWPLDILNEIIGGLTNELVYICAGESIGKTALVLQLLMENERSSMFGAMASLESSVKRLIPRMISQIACINTLDVDRGHHTPEIMEAIDRAVSLLHNVGFKITDRPMNLDQLHAWARLAVSQGASFLVVDNTRHIKVKGNMGSDPVLSYSQISLRLKEIRDDVDVPVIALHHTNKEGDVSWSRDLRKDVDVLIFMRHNEQDSIPATAQNKWMGRWIVDFDIDKNRDGRKGMTVKREFHKETQTFLQHD